MDVEIDTSSRRPRIAGKACHRGRHSAALRVHAHGWIPGCARAATRGVANRRRGHDVVHRERQRRGEESPWRSRTSCLFWRTISATRTSTATAAERTVRPTSTEWRPKVCASRTAMPTRRSARRLGLQSRQDDISTGCAAALTSRLPACRRHWACPRSIRRWRHFCATRVTPPRSSENGTSVRCPGSARSRAVTTSSSDIAPERSIFSPSVRWSTISGKATRRSLEKAI